MMKESLISTEDASEKIILSDTEKADLVKLGSLRWTEDKIATFFGWDRDVLHRELNTEGSEIKKLILRGELEAEFKLQSKLLADAQGGNFTAAKQFQDIVKDREFRIKKLDLFGGSEDVSQFEQVAKYIESGCPGNLSDNEQLKLQTLQMIYAFNVHHGDRKTVRFLTRPPFSLSYELAKTVMSEAVEFFNSGRQVSKASMRNHIAEAYDTLYHAILDTAKTPQEFAIAAGILDKKARVLQLDQPDVEKVAAAQYVRSFRVLTLNPEILGLPAANRDVLAAQIDALEVPLADKTRLKMEARVMDADIVKMIDNVVEEEN